MIVKDLFVTAWHGLCIAWNLNSARTTYSVNKRPQPTPTPNPNPVLFLRA